MFYTLVQENKTLLKLKVTLNTKCDKSLNVDIKDKSWTVECRHTYKLKQELNYFGLQKILVIQA